SSLSPRDSRLIALAQEGRMARWTICGFGPLGFALLASAPTPTRADTIVLPTFDVVATTPLNGGQINVSQSPFAVWQTNSQDIQTFNDTTLPDTLARS